MSETLPWEAALRDRDQEAIEDVLDDWSKGISPHAQQALSEHDRADLSRRVMVLLDARLKAREDPESDLDQGGPKATEKHRVRKTALERAMKALAEREEAKARAKGGPDAG